MKVALIIIAIGVFGCAKGSDSSASSEGVICRAQRTSHSGCCSSHGGFTGACGSGEARYGDSSGRLVCNDGSFSPSCTY